MLSVAVSLNLNGLKILRNHKESKMYKSAYFCIACKEELTYNQKMDSNGRCPKCGFKSASAGTIVSVKERAYRWVKVPSGKWWIPDKRIREFSDN